MTSTTLDSLAGQPAEIALPRLLEEHGDRLFHIALRLCGHRDDAEDLVQEIFLIALRKWKQFQGDARPTTWLYTIASRACMRRRRKRAGEPPTIESLEALLPGGDAQIPDPSALAQSALDEQLRREAQDRVDAAIASLPIEFRMPLVLKEIVELPIAEIAQILDLKEATVKTRVHRARLKLRNALAEALPRTDAPPPDHSRQICLDLLRAKQESMDRGVPFRAEADLCLRCRSMFATLDLAHDTCQALGRGEMPEELRQVLLDSFARPPRPEARGIGGYRSGRSDVSERIEDRLFEPDPSREV